MSLRGLLAKAAPVSAAFLFAATLAGCAGPDSFGGSRGAVVDWAGPRGFVAEPLRVGAFDLLALVRRGVKQPAALTIYVEGDGAAWHSPWHPPADPTPFKPLALALAAADPSANVAYLGRPCQYLDAVALKSCAADYWTQRRFAPEVIEAYMVAADQLKARHGAVRLRLVGHSGGGVIATLLAMRRDDVELLVTVASPLSLGDWAHHHGVSPLVGSLDPAITATPLKAARAVHFVGERDKVVPAAVVEKFVSANGGRVIKVPGFEHECCWARDWSRLLEELK